MAALALHDETLKLFLLSLCDLLPNLVNSRLKLFINLLKRNVPAPAALGHPVGRMYVSDDKKGYCHDDNYDEDGKMDLLNAVVENRKANQSEHVSPNDIENRRDNEPSLDEGHQIRLENPVLFLNHEEVIVIKRSEVDRVSNDELELEEESQKDIRPKRV